MDARPPTTCLSVCLLVCLLWGYGGESGEREVLHDGESRYISFFAVGYDHGRVGKYRYSACVNSTKILKGSCLARRRKPKV